MELILKHPTIKSFLLGFNREDYTPTLRQLVLIGIETVLAKFKGTNPKELKNMLLEWTKPQRAAKPTKNEGTIVRQIEEIKEELLKINEKFESVGESKCEPVQETNKQRPPSVVVVQPNASTLQSVLVKEEMRRIDDRRKSTVTPKVTEVYPEVDKQEPVRRPDRRWLDDTQSRMAMTYEEGNSKSQPKVRFQQSMLNREKEPISNCQDLAASQPISNAVRMQTYQTVVSNVFKTETDQYLTANKQTSKSPSNLQSKKKQVPATNYNTTSSQRTLEIQPKYLKKVQSKIKDLIREDKLRSQMNSCRKDRSQNDPFAKHSQKQNLRIDNQRLEADFTLKNLETKGPATRKPHNHESDQSDQSFSPYKQQESNIVIANRFLSSQLVQQFSQSNLSDPEEDASFNQRHLYESKDEDSQFSVFSPNFTEVTDSAASFRQPPSNHRRNKEIGKISRKKE